MILMERILSELRIITHLFAFFHSYWNGNRRVEYVCRSYHRGGKAICSSHRIHEEVIDQQVTEQLAEQKLKLGA